MNIDPSKIRLTEEDIEQWLWEHPESLGVEKWIVRQLHLPSGIADLVGYKIINTFFYPVVTEVKNVSLTSSALTQVCRYAKDLEYALGKKIIKLVVSPKLHETHMQFEADALGIDIYKFELSFDVHLSSKFRWTEEFEEELLEKYDKLKEMEFVRLFMELQRDTDNG